MRRPLAALAVITAACGLSVTGLEPVPVLDGEEAGTTKGKDAGAEADAAAAAPPFAFGEDCPAGTVYDDDFSTDPSNRWQVVAGTWEWSPTNHTYTLKPLKADGTDNVGIVWLGPRPKWKDYDVDVTETIALPPSDHGDVGPLLRVGDIPKKVPQPANDGAMYLAAAQVLTGSNLILGRFKSGTFTQLAGNNDGYDTTKRLTVHASVAGTTLKAWLNADTANSLTTTDSTYATGSIGLRAYKSAVVVTRVTVTCR